MPTPPIQQPSCGQKIQDYCNSPKTIQTAKFTSWAIGSLGSNFIPVPFLNGFLTGAMLFISAHEISKHPDSIFMMRYHSLVLSRTWKHLSAGATLSGIGFGLGRLALGLSPGFLITGWAIGSYLGYKIAYSDTCFSGDYQQMEQLPTIPEEQPPSNIPEEA